MFLLIKILTSINISLCPTMKKHSPTGTLNKNLGNGNLADFLATISANFIESGTRQNQAQFCDTPDQAQSSQSIRIGPNQLGSGDPIRPNQTQLGVNFGDAPDRRPNFGDALIIHDAKKWCAAVVLCLPR
jgi:hypothetical protein